MKLSEEEFIELPLSNKLKYIYEHEGLSKEEADEISFFPTLEDEAAALETQLAECQEKSCDWQMDNDDYCVWETQCGHSFYFVDGDVAENGFDYCPYCRGKIIAHKKDNEECTPTQ